MSNYINRGEVIDVKQNLDFQEFVDEVIAKTDIVDTISRYVTLKRVGNRFQALCPLHNDKKTPSFSQRLWTVLNRFIQLFQVTLKRELQ